MRVSSKTRDIPRFSSRRSAAFGVVWFWIGSHADYDQLG